MDTRHFSKIRTLKDIKIEKAKIRYEMLLAENKLMESFGAIQQAFTITTIFSRITQGFHVALNVYHNVRKFMDKIFRRKKRKKKNVRGEED
jgi:hypothetical protein